MRTAARVSLPAHPRHHGVRATHRIPTSPVTAAPAEPEPVDAGPVPESAGARPVDQRWVCDLRRTGRRRRSTITTS